MAIQSSTLLDRLCAELSRKFQASTILLYGSRANGTDGPESDIDIAAFGMVEAPVRDARVVDGFYLDAFVYPETELANPTAEHLKLRGGMILAQQDSQAAAFLAKLDKIHAEGPVALPQDEIAARKAWARKMCVRIQRGDIEGNFRRAWLLTALLEDYFQLRGLWYEGPKRSIHWLRTHDPRVATAFELALLPTSSIEAISALAEAVAGHA